MSEKVLLRHARLRTSVEPLSLKPSCELSSAVSHRGDSPRPALISRLSDVFSPILSGNTREPIPPSLPPSISALFVCFTLVFRSLSLRSCPSSLSHAPGLQKRGFPGRPLRYKNCRLARVQRLSAGSRRFPGMYFFSPLQWCSNSESGSPPVFVPSSLLCLCCSDTVNQGEETSSSIRKATVNLTTLLLSFSWLVELSL